MSNFTLLNLNSKEYSKFNRDSGAFKDIPITELNNDPLKEGKTKSAMDSSPKNKVSLIDQIKHEYLTWIINIVDRFTSELRGTTPIAFRPSTEDEEHIYIGINIASTTILIEPFLGDLVEQLYEDLTSVRSIAVDTILEILSNRGLVKEPTYEQLSERVLKICFKDLSEIDHCRKYKTNLAKILTSPACIIIPVLLVRITGSEVYLLECREIKGKRNLILSLELKGLISKTPQRIEKPSVVERKRESYIVPYLPTPHILIGRIVDLINPRAGEVFCDFGSGDGRILIAVARRGCYSIGIEIDRRLIKKCFRNIKSLYHNIDLILGDMFYYPLRRVDIIYTFLDEKAMRLLKEDLEEIIDRGTKVVSLTYRIPKRRPTLTFRAYDKKVLEVMRALLGDVTDKLREYKVYVYL